MIDTVDQAAGDYKLTLESFNTLSIAQSALKTDTIFLKIVNDAYPSFLEELQSLVLSQGVDQTYILPEINPGDSSLKVLKVKKGGMKYHCLSMLRLIYT